MRVVHGRRLSMVCRPWWFLVASFGAWAASNLFVDRPPSGFTMIYDGVLINVVLLGAGLHLCALASRLVPGARASFLVIGFGGICWAVGNTTWAFLVRPIDPEPFPSVADAFWLTSYVIIGAGLGLSIRTRAAGARVALVLDALIGALAMGATLAWISVNDLLKSVDGSTATVIVNLAYPIGDLLLLVLVVADSLLEGRVGPRRLLLLAGLAIFAVGDTVYLRQVATGSYTGGLVDLSWVTGLVLISLTPVVRETPPNPASARTRGATAVPVALAGTALAFVTLHDVVVTPPLTFWLSIAALALAVPRLLLAGRDARDLQIARLQAYTDELTGLRNRRALFERLADRLAALDNEGGRVAIMVLDLNGFKAINDRCGHLVGDQLLRSFARRFRSVLRSDDLAARLGGDEFAAVIRCRDPEEAMVVAREIASARDSGELDGHLGVSIGVAIAPDHGTEAGHLLALADRAMYQSKRNGGLEPQLYAGAS